MARKVGMFALGVAVLLVLAVVLFPLYASNAPPIRTVRLSSAKRLGTAALLYAEDSNGRLAPIDWRPALGQYTESRTKFDNRQEDRAFVFAHRATLIGARLDAIQQPEEKALVFDVTESCDPFVAELPALAYRTAGRDSEKKATVAFADGHAKALMSAQALGIR